MKTKIKILNILFIILFFNSNFAYSAMSGNDGNNKTGMYKSGLYNQAKKLVIRAKKLEKKNKIEKAYSKDKKNADILNYLGYTLRKTGNFEKAEIYYLKGLELDAGHLGINEYLGELYVQTNRIDLAKKRLNVLKGCNCEEYTELKELIDNK